MQQGKARNEMDWGRSCWMGLREGEDNRDARVRE